MKHIVFLLGAYYPRFSAVGVCAHRVINVLKGDFRISVVAMADEQAIESRVSVEGVEVYRVATPAIVKRSQLAHRLRVANTWSDRIGMYALRGRSAIKRLTTRATVNRSLVEAYKRQLAAIPDIDVVIPLVFPFESVIAALEYKSTCEVSVVPYLFDNFVDSRSLHVLGIARILKRKRHLRLEAEMIERSSAVLSMHQLAPHYRKEFGANVEKKFHFLEHPLLTKTDVTCKSETSIIRLVYTGALVKNVREADYVLELLDGIDSELPVEADFYAMGSAASTVESKVTRFGVVVRNHGQVSKRDADNAVAASSVLLNIGEVEGKQISSKIFEYMSVGKPIVHFAYTDCDAVTKVLARYPLALCLIQERANLNENRERFLRFVLEHAGCRMQFEAVASIFPEALPETTASIIGNLIKGDRAV